MSKFEKLEIIKTTYEKIRTLQDFALQTIQSVEDQEEIDEINKYLYLEIDDHGRKIKTGGSNVVHKS